MKPNDTLVPTKPYAAPTLSPLGSIASLTAGEFQGSLDCLTGDGTVPGNPFNPTDNPNSCDATS